MDRDRRPGRFPLTGSANPLLARAVTESLAGRMEMIQLHPLAESEKARRPGGFVKARLEVGSNQGIGSGTDPADPAALADRLVAGGYPEPLGRPPRRARQWHRRGARWEM